ADSTGDYIYIAEHTANQVQEYSTDSNSVTRTFPLPDAPTGVAVSVGDTELYVTAGSYDGKVYVVNLSTGDITHTIDVGHTPMSPVLSADNSRLYVCNRFDNNIAVISLPSYVQTNTVGVLREPVAMAITPDSDYLVVANHLPDGPANTGNTASSVSIINTSSYSVTNIQLPNGSTGMRGICISPDGQYAYATHVLGRYQVPTSQLERGWIMTNAVSVIDITGTSLVNTFLVDDVEMGAANPWAVACTTGDPNYLCVTHAGSHELSVIDLPGVHNRLNNLPYTGGFSKEPNDVPNDLGFLSGLRKRITLAGKGPRAVAIIGREAYVAEYFSDSISLVNIDTDNVGPILLGPQNPMTEKRKGEFYYYDANETFQKWLSCTSCHPDARSDALNWDLANDGYGSPRNAKSHLYSHMTPPTTITGCRPDAYTSVRAGFKFIEFAIRPEEDANAVDEFMISLEPVPSPYLVYGQLSYNAQQGKPLFQARCASCHSGEYFTDMNSHDVGTGRSGDPNLDTPTLVEVWQTGPYLQDGRAATMQEVLTTYNPSNQHGTTSDLTEQQINDLAEYVLSLPEPPQPGYPGDFDIDGDVDLDDLGTLGAAWLSDSGDGNWNPNCDIGPQPTPDEHIDFLDYCIFAENYPSP
ncbi:MAG: c-type cytochrome, partial [Planctomycetota bacterium]